MMVKLEKIPTNYIFHVRETNDLAPRLSTWRVSAIATRLAVQGNLRSAFTQPDSGLLLISS